MVFQSDLSGLVVDNSLLFILDFKLIEKSTVIMKNLKPATIDDLLPFYESRLDGRLKFTVSGLALC